MLQEGIKLSGVVKLSVGLVGLGIKVRKGKCFSQRRDVLWCSSIGCLLAGEVWKMLAFGLSVLSLSRLRGAVFARGCRTSSCDKSEGLVKTTRSRTTMIRGFPNEFNNSPNADGHDRLIGELVDFPCVFIFKVVGTNEGEFMDDIVDTVSECVNIDSDKLKVSFRDRGR